MTDKPIPFNRPCFQGKELDYITEAVGNLHISGDGPFTTRCQEFLQTRLGVPKAFLTTSCTDALEMAAILLNIQPGDEFIVPSFTFVSTVNAFVLRGAKPVFIDIRPDTLNLDETLLADKITDRTKAIVVVHYAGVACDMDAILAVADERGVPVIEDNAHGLFGKYKGRYLGTLGCMATQSFHETKNVTCGEGGALLINDTQYVDRAEIVREKGTNRSQFFRGQVDKYTWTDVGSSFLPSDILAAFLYAQLESVETIQADRERIWTFYQDRLSDWAAENHVTLPVIPSDCEQPYHMFYLIMATPEARSNLIATLRDQNILSVFHYLPLHLSDMGKRFGGQIGDCPVTEDITDRLVRLPFYNGIAETDLARVVQAIQDC
jgi:dTDP-4-amino-4,6-dideoxygalactose transaminase